MRGNGVGRKFVHVFLLSDVVIISREEEPVKRRISPKVVSITIKNPRYIEPPFGGNRRGAVASGVYNCGL
jgi:hypothetical protein